MPDILIRGMEMPRTCFECPFMYSRLYCSANHKLEFSNEKYSELEERYTDCPLHELPEHGDLISAEDVKTVIDRFIGYLDEDMIFRIKYKLNQDCPVIVPSNREETE